MRPLQIKSASLLLLLLLLLFPLTLQALPGDLLPVSPVVEAPAVISAQMPLPDGGHLIAGFFNSTDSLLRLKPDGTRDTAWRSPLTLTTGGIRALQRLPDGRLWVERGASAGHAYLFSYFNSGSGWVVLHLDGTMDAAAFPALPRNATANLQFFSETTATFRVAAAQERLRLRRFFLSDGAEDAGFQPAFDSAERILAAAPAADGGTWVLTESGYPSSDPFDFERYLLHRLLPQGAPDPAFPPRTLPEGFRQTMESTESGGIRLTGLDTRYDRFWPTSSGSGFTVNWLDAGGATLRTENFSLPNDYASLRLVEEPGGALLGNFSSYGEIYRRLPDRTLDPSFLLVPSPLQQSVLLDRLPDGRLLVNGFQRFLSNGAPDPGFHPEMLHQSGAVTHLTAAPDGGFYVLGNFTRIGGLARPGLARMTAAGAVDPAFAPPADLGAIIRAHPLAGDKLLVLHQPAGVPVPPAPPREYHSPAPLRKLTRLLPDGSRDPLFNVNFEPPGVPAPAFRLHWRDEALIAAATPQPDGRILVSLFRPHSETRESRFLRLLPDGAVDTGFTPSETLNAGDGIHVFPDGAFLSEMLLHTKDGKPVKDFSSGFTGRLLSMLSGGRAVIMSRINGRNTISLLDSVGNLDPTFFDALSPEAFITAVTEAPDGKIYLAGSLWIKGGKGRTLLRLHRNGLKDATFHEPALLRNPPPPPDAASRFTFTDNGLAPLSSAFQYPESPSALMLTPATGALWLGGDYQSADGQARNGLAAVSGVNAIGYETWIAACAAPFSPEPAALSPEADADRDGQPNWLEYATAADPFTPDAPATALTLESREPLTFSTPRNPEAPEVLAVIEVSENLRTWRTAGGAEVSLTGSGSRLAFSLLPGTPHRYVRVRFTRAL